MSTPSNPLVTGAPSLQPPSATQTMLAPDGTPGEVPVDRVQDAVKAGFKMGVSMTAPDGTSGTIPVDKAHDAVKAGFKPLVTGVQSPTNLTGAAYNAVAGPTTALGTPASPAWSQEASGVGEILHGNVRQGAGKIWDAEKPHVIQGSWLEKAIQKFDPTFQGGVTNEKVQQYNNTYDALGHPLVDVASSIDKDQHPVGKALAESAQSLLTPDSMAVLYSTGGLGLVDSPAKLAIANKLISGGFSAAAIASAYKNLKDFKQAVETGDSNEAAYQLTHAVTSGTLGLLAARGAVTDKPLLDKPLLQNPFRRATAPAEPGVVTQVLKGENVAQAPAQAALRTAAETVTPGPSPASLRTSLESPIARAFSDAKALYKTIDDASGTDFKALNDKLDNAEYQVSLTPDGSPEEAKWEQARQNILDKIADAKQKALAAGVDPTTLDQADAKFTQARALQDLQTKVFKNPSIVSGNAAMGASETINVPSAVKALQKLQDTSKFGGPRLEQALGKDGADALLQSLYDAQRAGTKAMTRQQLAMRIAKATPYVAGAAGGLTLGWEGLKHILGLGE